MALLGKTKALLTKIIKSSKSVKITGDINVVEDDKSKRKKAENQMLKNIQLGFRKSTSAISEKMAGVSEKGQELAGKGAETVGQIFTSTGLFGQTLGLLNESLKGFGVDVPKMIGDKITEKKEIKDDSVAKIEKKEIKEEEKPTKIEEESSKIDDHLKIISEEQLVVQKEQLEILKGNKIFDEKNTKAEATIKTRESRIDKIDEAKSNRNKKQENLKKVKADKKKEKKDKKEKKKESKPMMVARIAAGAIGAGLLIKDFMKGGAGGAILGDIPELYERTEGKIDWTKKKEGTGKEVAGFVMSQAAKFGALGFAAGGAKGGLIGGIAGALLGGMEVVVVNWIMPAFSKLIEWVKGIKQSIVDLGTSIKDAISKGPLGSFIKFKKEGVGERDVEIKGIKEGMYSVRQYIEGEKKGQVYGKHLYYAGEKGEEKRISLEKFAKKRYMEDIFGKDMSGLKKSLISETKEDEKILAETYRGGIENLINKFKLTDTETLLFRNEIDKELNKVLIDLNKNIIKERATAEQLKLLKEADDEKRSELAETMNLVSSDIDELLKLKLSYSGL